LFNRDLSTTQNELHKSTIVVHRPNNEPVPCIPKPQAYSLKGDADKERSNLEAKALIGKGPSEKLDRRDRGRLIET